MARDALSFDLLGSKELDNALKKLPSAMSKSVLRAALKKAGQPVVNDAKSKAPRDRGDLAESIEIRPILSRRQRRRRAKKGDIEMFIGATFPRGAHAHLVEFGTSSMPARPFLRPAWDSHKRGVSRAIGRELWKALARAAKTLAKKATGGKLKGKAFKELLG